MCSSYQEVFNKQQDEIDFHLKEIDRLKQAFDVKDKVHSALNKDYVKLREESKKLRECIEDQMHNMCNCNYEHVELSDECLDCGMRQTLEEIKESE